MVVKSQGPSHASGGVLIEAEGGEGIINKHSMSNPLLRSIASAVNVAGGGVRSLMCRLYQMYLEVVLIQLN